MDDSNDSERCRRNCPHYGLTALGVIGSRARGDHGPYSDLDLIGVSREKGFVSFEHAGTFTELHRVPDVADYARKSSWWYPLRDLQIVHDDGSLAWLKRQLPGWFSSYVTSPVERERNRYWLLASRRKLLNSRTALRLNYELSTSFWQLLIGSFLAKNLPVPASSDMFRLVPEIVGKGRLEQLLLADDDERKQQALKLIQEIVETSCADQ